MKIKAILIALALAGCALAGCVESFDPPVKREYTLPEVMVKWVEVGTETELFAACQHTQHGGKTLACAHYNKAFQTCTIYTHKEPPMDLLGHEMLHCFTGAWHS